MGPRSPTASRLSPRRTSLAFVGVAVICALCADLQVSTLAPWQELGRFAAGLFSPDFASATGVWTAMLYTVAFGVVGTVAGAIAGFGLALFFGVRAVRGGAAFVRAIHELFWALIFLQLFGLSPLTGVLAIALPYTGIFAKVYSEILEEADAAPLRALPTGSGVVSAFLFARLPDAWAAMKSYTYYRLECGLRSSAVLGFVGLPTLGFFLESTFAQGYYAQAAVYLLALYLIIATSRLWLPAKLALPAALAAVFALPSGSAPSWHNVLRFFSHDIVPAPLRTGVDFASLADFGHWLANLWANQAWPGLINTVIVTQIALVATGALALLLFPLIARRFVGRFGLAGGHGLLVVLRSTPEYVLAYLLLQLWGPSMLPAVVALTLHNGAIIGFLTGRVAERLRLRADAPSGLNLYGYEILPRVYGPFLAYLFYRWEILMRETAVLGILGVHTLGFYVDSAMAEIRLDRALVLLLITAVLNMGIDALSRHLRARMRFAHTPAAVQRGEPAGAAVPWQSAL